MAGEIKAGFGAETELIAGSGGIFDVKLDGETVYLKADTGRFPKPGEVTAILNG